MLSRCTPAALGFGADARPGAPSLPKAGAMRADLIIRNGHIVSMDRDFAVHIDGAVVVSDGRIVAAGPASVAEGFTASREIDADGGLVIPGLINSHCHFAMTPFRGLGEGLPNRLERFMWPLERDMVDGDLVETGAILGAIEMVVAGTTCVVDSYTYPERRALAADRVGLRALIGQTVMNQRTPDSPDWRAGIRRAEGWLADWAGHRLVTPILSPHSPYALDDEALGAVVALSDRSGCGITMHVSEFEWEAQRLRERRGLTPIAHLDALGYSDRVFIAAHCIFVDDDDIAIMARGGMSVAHNMVANIKSGKGVAPAAKLRRAGVAVGLGTDGPMSGNGIDTLGQLGYVAKVANLMANDNAAMPPRDVVEMATIGAARAIGMADEIGSLEAGKKADIAIIRTDQPHMQPLYDVYTSLVFSATTRDVATTIVDGRIVASDGVALQADMNAAVADVRAAGEKLAAHIGLPPLAMSGGHAIAPARPFLS